MPVILDDEGFAARLKTHPAGVWFFFGEEEFLKRRAARRLEELITENEAFNVQRLTLSAKDDCVRAVQGALSEIPFLSEYRYTRIDHCAFWLLNRSEGEAFCAALRQAPEDQILVFFYPANEASIQKDSGSKVTSSYVYSHLPENACVVEFKRKSPEFLAGYLRKKLEKSGVTIASDAALNCAVRCECALERIETILPALIARAQTSGGEVTSSILDEYTVETPEQKVYLFTGAVQEKKLNESIRFYEKLRASKIEPILLCAALNRAFLNLIAVKSGAPGVQKQFRISDYPYKLLQANARLWTQAELQNALKLCMRADTLMKNTSLDPDGILKEMLVRILHAHNRR